MRHEERQRAEGVDIGQDMVPLLSEHISGKAEKTGIVLDDKNSPRAARAPARRLRRAGEHARILQHRWNSRLAEEALIAPIAFRLSYARRDPTNSPINRGSGHTNARGGISTRARLSERIARLWQGTLQLDGTWIVDADKTSDQIRDELTDCLSDGDALLVIGASIDAAWAGFQDADCDWLVEHI
jgi:hypothetical protein